MYNNNINYYALYSQSESFPKKNTSSTPLGNAGAGLIIGTLYDTFSYYLDSNKTLVQGHSVPKWSLSDIFKKPLAESKQILNHHYRGFFPITAIGSGISFALYFGLFAACKENLCPLLYKYNEHNPNNQLSQVSIEVIQSLVCSLFAGVPSSIIVIPSDVIKKRIILADKNVPFLTVCSNIYQKEGLKGFFRGWRANVLKDVPVGVCKMFFYDLICNFMYYKHWSSWYPHQIVGSSPPTTPNYEPILDGMASLHLSKIEAAICGLISGSLTGFLTVPFDNINTHIKNPFIPPATNKDIRTSFKHLYQEGGIPRFFRGTYIRLCLYGVYSAFLWPIFNTVVENMPQHQPSVHKTL